MVLIKSNFFCLSCVCVCWSDKCKKIVMAISIESLTIELDLYISIDICVDEQSIVSGIEPKSMLKEKSLRNRFVLDVENQIAMVFGCQSK